jgi:iron complex transport system substrate-binding protein
VRVRIVSLLPSATEIVYRLGLEDSLVGVTHECDWPPAAREKTQVSFTNIPPDATPAEINDLADESEAGGPPTHGLHADVLRDLAPDLVLTQDLCAVCAVPAGHLQAALDDYGVKAETLSLDPASLQDVITDVWRVGQATGTESRARKTVDGLQARLARVEEAVAGRERRRTFALEWGDPAFNAGHWVPDQIEAAGGEPLLTLRGVPSIRVDWEDIAAENPEVVVFMPCGYNLDGAMAQVPYLLARPEMATIPSVFAAAANGFYSRPGPRLVDGVEGLAWALHPDCGIDAPPGTIARVK